MARPKFGRLLGVAFVAAGCAVGALPAAASAATITEFSAGITSGSTPFEITAGPDGNLWFTEVSGDRIGRITPTGTVTEFGTGITPGSVPADIAAGPDGNLWFTEQSGGRIGRITPTGTVTEFSAGITPGSVPADIVAGPDGNLWYADSADRVGRITPTGTVTEFSTGITAGSGPYGIAAGPDGNLWFTETNGDRIGQITPTGTVTEFSTGISSGSHPRDIAPGPDGNLWFTEFLEGSPGQIGRITPSGSVTEFSTGISPNSGPAGIIAGPDGNLWFTEQNAAQVAQITPAGDVTEFGPGITPGSNPLGITAGPDGNLWVTEQTGDRIARVPPDVIPLSGSLLTIVKAGSGQGTVTSSPVGIDCGSECSLRVANGTAVTLIPDPGPEWVFAGFSGGGCSGTGPCTVTVNEATSVTATFTPVQRVLTVSREGSGEGTVTSDPAGIDCGSDCSAPFDIDTVVTLAALPASGSTFVGWDADGCSSAGPCTVALNEATSVTAIFTRQPAQITGPVPPSAEPTATPSQTALDVTTPGVSHVRVTRSAFAVGGATPPVGVAAAAKTKRHKKGTAFEYTLTEAATVKIVISRVRSGRRTGTRCVAPTRKLRKAKKCTRTSVKGSVTRTSHQGANRVAFSGRIGSKALKPGRYRATLTATDAAHNASRPKTISLKIVKR